MGVRGLQSFVSKYYSTSFSQYKLRNTALVVDANNFAISTYSDLWQLDRSNGGDMQRFAHLLQELLESFERCGIILYFIFDGIVPDDKFDTIIIRKKKKMMELERISTASASMPLWNHRLYPPLIQKTLKDILQKNSINYGVSQLEADDDVASLANKHQCAVFSDDSDFMLMDIPGGVIRINTFSSEVCEERSSSGASMPYMNCQLYKRDSLARPLRINPALLPCLAVLLGNDRIHGDSQILRPFKQQRIRYERGIQAAVTYLAGFPSVDSVMADMQGFFPGNQWPRVKAVVENALGGYAVKATSSVSNMFQNIVAESDYGLRTKRGGRIPGWVLMGHTAGKLPTLVMKVLCQEYVMMEVHYQVLAKPDVTDASRHIRQCTYAILLYNHQNIIPDPGYEVIPLSEIPDDLSSRTSGHGLAGCERVESSGGDHLSKISTIRDDGSSAKTDVSSVDSRPHCSATPINDDDPDVNDSSGSNQGLVRSPPSTTPDRTSRVARDADETDAASDSVVELRGDKSNDDTTVNDKVVLDDHNVAAEEASNEADISSSAMKVGASEGQSIDDGHPDVESVGQSDKQTAGVDGVCDGSGIGEVADDVCGELADELAQLDSDLASTSDDNEKVRIVIEYSREEATSNLRKSMILAAPPPGFQKLLPTLERIPALTRVARRKVLLDVLKIPDATPFQDDIVLLLGATRVWLDSDPPRVVVCAVVSSLLVGYHQLGFSRQATTAPTQRNPSHIHCVTAWLNCVQVACQLNDLLQTPVPTPVLHEWYSNFLTLNIIQELCMRKDVVVSAMGYLVKSPKASKLYSKIIQMLDITVIQTTPRNAWFDR